MDRRHSGGGANSAGLVGRRSTVWHARSRSSSADWLGAEDWAGTGLVCGRRTWLVGGGRARLVGRWVCGSTSGEDGRRRAGLVLRGVSGSGAGRSNNLGGVCASGGAGLDGCDSRSGRVLVLRRVARSVRGSDNGGGVGASGGAGVDGADSRGGRSLLGVAGVGLDRANSGGRGGGGASVSGVGD